MEWLRKRDDKGKKTLIASPYGTSCFAISVSPQRSLESLEGIVLYLLYVVRIGVSILNPNRSTFCLNLNLKLLKKFSNGALYKVN